MGLYDDPALKEVLDDFSKEALELLEELDELIEDLEEDPTLISLYEKSDKTIQKILEAAKTVGLPQVILVCQLIQAVCLRSTLAPDHEGARIIQKVLFGTLDILKLMMERLGEQSPPSAKQLSNKTYRENLNKLSQKLGKAMRPSLDYFVEKLGLGV